MSSARQGFFWWELDVSYYVLRVLAAIGVGPALTDARGASRPARVFVPRLSEVAH